MTQFFRRIGILLMILVVLPIVSYPSQRIANGQSGFQPEFMPSSCPEDINAQVEIECGTVVVPERHANVDGETIGLAVMILHSTNPNPAPDPLVMAQGGPGGSTIDFFGSVMTTGLGSGLLAERDIVLIEQRGTFYSKPDLVCEEFLARDLEVLDQPLSVEDSNTINLEAAIACYERLNDEGIDLSAFNSVENAHDVPLVVAALGYSDYNYYGVSYGTMVAQHLMRDHPENLRSVIMDSVVPLDINFIPQVPFTADRAFRLLFEACGADVECNADFPELEAMFFNLVDELNASPLIVPIADPDNEGVLYDYALTGDRLVEFLFRSLYVTSVIPLLPRYIYGLANGDMTWVEFMMPSFVFNRTRAGGMYYSVLCAEDADFDANDFPLDGIYEPIVRVLYNGDRFPATCAAWQVEQLDYYVDEPIQSDIPTLVLSGEFDPITPPSGGMWVAERLTSGHFFTFPATGHGVLLGGECPRSMIEAFLVNPSIEPDSGCIGNMSLAFAPAFTGRLVPIRLESQGFETVMPDGWQRFDNVIVRGTSPADEASIALLGIPQIDIDEFLDVFISELGTERPQYVESVTRNNYVWERYDVAFEDTQAVIMFTATDTRSYAFLLFGTEDEIELLVETVLLPMLDAFNPIE